MPDRHRRPTVTGRPEQAAKEHLETVLKANGWSIDAFVVAAVLWGLDNPDEALRMLQPFKPDEQPRGRPRKQPDSLMGGRPHTTPEGAALSREPTAPTCHPHQ